MPDNQNQAQYTSERRLVAIKTKEAESDLWIERMTGTEGISTLFEYKLRLASRKQELDMKALLGTEATVKIAYPNEEKYRYFNGIISSFRQTRQKYDDLIIFEATLVPKLWLLGMETDSRIFQNKSVPEIVEQVLKPKVPDLKMGNLPGKYPKREYCVQYRETTLNFVLRLLEEEGLFFYFDHEEKKHTMVFADMSSTLEKCPDQEEARCDFSSEGTSGEDDGIFGFDPIERLHTNDLTYRDFNFENPSLSLEVSLTGDGSPAKGYDYPGRYMKRNDGDRYVKLRLERAEMEKKTAEGHSRCRLFRTGYKFKLQDHYRKDLNNKEYILTSVTHDAEDTTYRTSDESAHRYENTFTVIPKETPFRPPAPPERPIVQGCQTAIVVGPSNEEIWTDKYGRVKVQFHWDRLGKKDENSSCWVRVSQLWAGKAWGGVAIPRIGQEVIVDFLEGNPDMPIIIGRVYNGDNAVPYTLPANQTQTGIKSRSSKAGSTDNFNELRFEDKKGSELVYVQAEKDMTTFVKNNDKQTIQNDRTISVTGKHTETIQKDMSITVTEGNRSLKVSQGNNSREISIGNDSITIKTGNKSTKVSLGKIEEEAMQSIELKVGGSSIKIDQTGVTIKGMMIKIDGSVMTEVKGGAILIAKGGITMIN